MPSWEVLITFTLAALIMNLSPGPSNLYVMARALSHGFVGGSIAAMGLAVGSLVHVVATTLGLAALFVYSPLAYTTLKLIGAMYLIYLAYRYWRAIPTKINANAGVPQKPLSTIFIQSVIVEITNPKTALFFIAFLPQFVDTSNANVSQQLLVLGLIVTASAIPCDLLVAFSAGKVGDWLALHPRIQNLQNKMTAAILLLLGLFVVEEEIRRQ